jgi:hypothetical protein
MAAALDRPADVVYELAQAGNWPAILEIATLQSGQTVRSALLVRSLIALFATCEGNPARRWGLYFRCGLQITKGKTMEQIADHFGITDAAISKEARQWIKEIPELPIPKGIMKSASACASYRRRQLRVSARKKSSPA